MATLLLMNVLSVVALLETQQKRKRQVKRTFTSCLTAASPLLISWMRAKQIAGEQTLETLKLITLFTLK